MSKEENLTAVEWLEQEFIALQNYGINELGLFAKAKEMEKEQIVNAYLFGERAYNFNRQDAEYYYNETYGEESDGSRMDV